MLSDTMNSMLLVEAVNLIQWMNCLLHAQMYMVFEHGFEWSLLHIISALGN